MPARTVTIGSRDTVRVAGLTRAIADRSLLDVVAVWPLERAITVGRDPDTAVVILDGCPSAAALHAMAEVTRARPELSVLVLGPLKPDVDVLITLASGASGYVPSDSSLASIADAVEALLAGDTVLPRAISLPLVQHLRWGGRGIVVTGLNGRSVELTNREWEVLVLLRQARSTAEIARTLVVSKGTVRSHVSALLRKLDADGRAGLSVAGKPAEQPGKGFSD